MKTKPNRTIPSYSTGGPTLWLLVLLVSAGVAIVDCKSGGTTSGNGGGQEQNEKTTSGKGGSGADNGGSSSSEKKESGTSSGKSSGGSQDNEITPEMRKDGFLSASSYQVFVTSFGASESEARDNGLRDGRRKALNLLRRDPALSGRRLSSSAQRELKRTIQQSARVVRLRHEPNGSWSVVVQIEKSGLRSFLKRLR